MAFSKAFKLSVMAARVFRIMGARQRRRAPVGIIAVELCQKQSAKAEKFF
jgi:hypothetical protein